MEKVTINELQQDEALQNATTIKGGAGETLHPYLELRLYSVKVTSYSVNGSGD